ncbi:MAG: DUF1549 and DUF1553 domain-containing protein [Fuerstiella sp.]|nr:DUF1549 and DUF1553 domain-containing protein [Fuerstiella sp.]
MKLSKPIFHSAGHLALLIVLVPVTDHSAVGKDTLEWPWTPLVEPAVPSVTTTDGVRNPIDAFVLSKLTSKGLTPAPPASPDALLRRLQFGLIGLPPSPQEMQAFVADPSDEAYTGLIEKLLDDEGYGERWGRHWLDLVRYADTRGGAIDYPRPHIWRYRDYVIRAFNQDRPYDRFIREQLAGDAFKYGDEGRIGLAFLHLWVPVERSESQLSRRDFLTDVVGVTGSVFLGVTLECARCHDHKYDPIPTRDYYRMEAFFAPLVVGPEKLPFGQYEKPVRNRETWEQQKQGWLTLLDKRKEWQDQKLKSYRERLRKRYRPAATAELKDVVAEDGTRDLPMAMDEGILFTPEEVATYRKIKRQTARFANPNHRDYFEPTAYLAKDSSLKDDVATYVLSGGSYKLREDAVEPGFLSAVTGSSNPVDLTGLPGTRRRLLADWIASPDNPLTARVMVNRIWQYHFGKGLIATSSDFGVNGSGGVYRDLIDWLAVQFRRSGYSIKEMHRLILTSNVYRQSMVHPRAAEFDKIDNRNKYLWVRNPVRHEAEVIRDSVLAVSGSLNREMGGPPFFPAVDDELMQRAPTWWEPAEPDQRHRRTVYMLQSRSLQLPFLKVFNGANIDESCPVRDVTTVTPQVFALFNSQFMQQQSAEFAGRITREAGSDSSRQVEYAYQLAYQRSPTSEELDSCLEFLERTESVKITTTGSNTELNHALAPSGSLTDLCLVLLNSNEFLYLQ